LTVEPVDHLSHIGGELSVWNPDAALVDAVMHRVQYGLFAALHGQPVVRGDIGGVCLGGHLLYPFFLTLLQMRPLFIRLQQLAVDPFVVLPGAAIFSWLFWHVYHPH